MLNLWQWSWDLASFESEYVTWSSSSNKDRYCIENKFQSSIKLHAIYRVSLTSEQKWWWF